MLSTMTKTLLVLNYLSVALALAGGGFITLTENSLGGIVFFLLAIGALWAFYIALHDIKTRKKPWKDSAPLGNVVTDVVLLVAFFQQDIIEYEEHKAVYILVFMTLLIDLLFILWRKFAYRN